MTLHTVRRKSGNGYREPKYKTQKPSVAIMCRLSETDFGSLRRIAVQQKVPMAHVIRDAVARYLRSRGHD
jgi:hypothetical protein